MLRYIGPFLRMNKLSIGQIQSQLVHLSKESIKNIVLYSKCGITLDPKELNLKYIPSTDINTLNLNSPLLCVYKKANPKLKISNNKFHWDEDKLKKDINISSNAYMTLCILELVDYYKKFKGIDSKKYSLSIVYTELAKKQLEFYASYLRNHEGVFIDKKDSTDPIIGKVKLKDKSTEFKFSEQALLMNAFYKCSTYLGGEVKDSYENFSLDILKMFVDFKEEMYDISFEDKCMLCLNLNIFYSYSKIDDVKLLLLDIFDLLYEEYNKLHDNDKVENICTMYLNSSLLYKHTGMFKFKKIANAINEILAKHYSEDFSIFIKTTESKEIKFSSNEIVLYLISMLHQNNLGENIDEKLITDVFKYQLVDSGIVLSWPDTPNLDDVEHYKNFRSIPENLLDEQYFKMPTIPSPETSELAPIFIKNVTYDKDKKSFKVGKPTFDSRKNLNLFFFILYFLKDETP